MSGVGHIRGLATALALAAPVAAPADPAAECTDRLSRTLAVMDERAPLKGELATGIMWLRLDAEEALAAGDTATCLQNVEVVETLLGVR